RGTSFLAGMLLLNMGTNDTFIGLINLIHNSPVLSALYNSDETRVKGYFKIFNVVFAEHMPKLYLHFKNLSLTPDNYLPDWLMTVFTSVTPLGLSSRLWDIFLLEGDVILFKTGLVVLRYLEPLLWGGGFSETVRILNMGFIGEHRG
ncbi:rab-GTPase-TBC domain-containing protein, partial [Halteromyces radiatus]|uniref:rab-GTPase-TBC domain-containing protein n=1 Tax=Halteromyces radiatus TaxID=101107 RepID=UPI0022204270